MIGPVARSNREPSRAIRWRAACLAAGVAALSACERPPTPGMLSTERVIGETGRQPGQFAYPRGMDALELDGRQLLLVVDKTARIQTLDARTGEPLASFRTPIWKLGMPTGLTVATHPTDAGRQAVWVADTHEHRVLVYPLPFDTDSQPAEPAFQFGSFGDGPGEFIYTTDVAVLNGATGLPETVFVSEYGGNDRVSVFRVRREAGAVRFEFERQIGISGVAMDAPEDDPAALSRPQAIATRRGGAEIVVADVGRHRVVRFETATGAVAGWTDGATMADGSACEPLRFPYGVTLIDDDHAVVAEFGASRLRVMEVETGRTLAFMGGPGRGPGQLATPWASVLVDDELMILDSGNDRVQVVRWRGVGGAG